MDTTDEPTQTLRRSARIAARLVAEKSRKPEMEASSSSEPSQPNSHTDPVLKHDCSACTKNSCSNCRLAFDLCVEMIDMHNARVGAAMNLTGKQFKQEIRMILGANKKFTRGLKLQQD
ncbi:hypothetical protein PENCOP_c007G01296 [Penicillium coprophilum]|uniref:Uncharacterized protein n=1 Tax=Penicillium coprophilum TaxID=36646 RepID=A0A1V6UL91_9EURO|nr:hypothetical protein PENCOP_c007G01296 [Penicillium coprophilum]